MRVHATLAALVLVTATAMAGGSIDEIAMKVGESFDQETGTFVEGAYENLLEVHGMIQMALLDEEVAECDSKALAGLDVLVAYNLACLESMNGEIESAFEWLTYAVDSGYADPAWMLEDTDLENLRGDDRFTLLVDAASANLEAMSCCGGCGPDMLPCGTLEEGSMESGCESCSE